ncbi:MULTISPECIES: 2-amino-4-hydroxy-6-hydroxymethyldihydropteridine diphosphokinase [Halomonadaceae]|jgi:2-amino-4-hydroxy-6-hydroxymethyldihydropteridine diphosphokinase|uniref:2-amino-4-hydroxy-6-hydroxymethyldihydropteridine pyrophosphokinase n=1 Tax=Vreelandella maris TaxID=2729617 RepID=A0A7Y6VA12_9GAMM|nr:MULTISPECIES: 2-amino-4-hydroxy-6-hydroxymethyldihydropteridine diphosphokinase [Halomonas]NVF15061.1 2-amino-4-hydroxy-6-hydroxymethyldihydropteridine diphosphokinase [Halomonas maris]PKG49421.1 2-amino-4-hydroxy-6-hydroxymethyldihydropteridine diphosphokinase [Halomonas sp. MES3-P3E]|tara:strand:- start:10897 stop:11343 length:447 start_codon:yes stop_codon:yes gene_type:complete
MPPTTLPSEQAVSLHECLISLGSNIDPEHYFDQALTILSQECKLLARSKAIRTTPVGYQQQPDFLNAALLVSTSLEQAAFRAYLKEVEDRLGRVRGAIKSGPRTMDLDMVAWDGEVVDEGYYQHDYVKVPVDEVLASSGRTLEPVKRL